jgi:OOP family OmpA-OmpF porin
MKLRLIVLALAVAVVPWIARAQPIQGIYVSGGAGIRAPFPTQSTSLAPGMSGYFDINQSIGFAGQLSAGYGLGNGWRFELEGMFGRSGVDRVSGLTFPATGSGTVRNWGFMTNAVFDLDIGSPYVYPYLGLGVGYQSTRLSNFVLTATGKPFSFSASGEAGGFAAQVISGLSFPIPNVPGLSITADYRIMDTLGGEKFSGVSTTGGGAPLPGSVKFHNQFDQSVMIGVRYAFNTPPPAAPASQEPTPAASARAQTYQVYFDLDKASLNDRALAVIREAAAASTRSQTTRIEVTGNADTSGNPAANQALSERRAKAVAGALIGDGVPKGAISIQAKGDTTPPVPTGPGVVEPRNRVVEIVPH